ncbi:MAG: hypothetical protein ACREDP_14720, partial [Bradyrhizobium sp.]
ELTSALCDNERFSRTAGRRFARLSSAACLFLAIDLIIPDQSHTSGRSISRRQITFAAGSAVRSYL